MSVLTDECHLNRKGRTACRLSGPNNFVLAQQRKLAVSQVTGSVECLQPFVAVFYGRRNNSFCTELLNEELYVFNDVCGHARETRQKE